MITLNALKQKFHTIPVDVVPSGLSAEATGIWLYVYVFGKCSTDDVSSRVIRELVDAGVMTEEHEIIIGPRKKKRTKKAQPDKYKVLAERYGSVQADAVIELYDDITELQEKKKHLDKWLVYRFEKKKPLTITSLRSIIRKMGKYDLKVVDTVVEKAIDSGWMGLFGWDDSGKKDINGSKKFVQLSK